jgi:serine protease AprX
VGLETGTLEPQQRYVIQVFEEGLHQKQAVAARIEALGGTIDALYPEFKLFQASMTPEQVTAVAGYDEVVWIDRWSAPEPDLNIVRIMSGANFLETMAGFTGNGVRAEAFDSGCDTTHPDFQHNNGVKLHGGNSASSHGTQVTGVVFGDGTGNSNWRGLLPDAKIIFASYSFVGNRLAHTAELVDPTKSYKCVFQTNSWGSSTTTSYNSSSTEMDRIVFDNDLLIFQSQSNTGNQTSRPQAWAKNVVAVGGINHGNTANKNNDFWGGASVGPAADGRIKPDLAHFYDSVTTPAQGGGYAGFGGTSCATPVTAGYSGLFFEMWHNNVWNNGASATNVFWSRPHFSLAKAALINTADQWTFSGAGANLHRYRQGWGSVDVKYMYELRDRTFWVDQTDPLGNLQTASYTVDVAAGEPQLRVTMVYPDPEGTSSSSLHRYNDLNLKLTPPTGSNIYWGNRGLKNNMLSVANGAANDVDTVENVFIGDPAPGQWTIEVIAEDVNTDGAPGVPGVNAVFSLWVTGATGDCASAPTIYCTAGNSASGCQATLSATGLASASATSGFTLMASGVEGAKDGLFFFGTNGRQANPWGSGTSFQCVTPPVIRAGLLSSTGTPGACDGSFAQDLNAHWCGSCSHPAKNPGAGAVVDAQLWYRDPMNTSNQTTSLSDAIEFNVCP